MGDDAIIAKAARVSTGKDQENHQKKVGLIRYLAREAHTSPFEHTALTVRIEAPIFVAREAMRHRTFSFNEISGRYAKLKPEFYVPGEARPLINKGSGAHPNLVLPEYNSEEYEHSEQYLGTYGSHIRLYDEAWEWYMTMLDNGI